MRTERRVRARSPRKTLGAVASVATIGVLAAACGGSSSGGSSDTGGGSTSSSSSDVPILLVAPLTGSNGAYTPWVNAVKGAFAAINANGGAGGHQIDLSVCDAGENANTELACGKEAVSKHVDGMITMMDLMDPLTQFTDPAGIPRFGFMVAQADWTDKLSYSVAFPTGGSAPFAKKEGCKKVVLVREDPGEPAERAQYIDSFSKGMKAQGITSTAVQVPADVSSGATYIDKALGEHPDCIDVQGFGAPMVSLMKAAGQLIPDSVKILSAPAFLPADTIASLGDILKRVLVADFAWPISSIADHPGLQTFKDEIEKYAPKPNALDNNSEDMWSNAHALADAIAMVQGDVTAAKVVAALNTFHDYDTKIGPPVSFDTVPTAPAPPRIFAPYAIGENYVNGERHAVTNFFNIYSGADVTS